MTDYPEFNFDTEDWANDQFYVDRFSGWDVKDLWEAANDLPEYEVPLVAIQTDLQPWDDVGDDFLRLCLHVKLINDADLDYPIILTPDGCIADGRHRLAKALVNGHTTIKVKRLPAMPDPSFAYDEDGNPVSV
jgi:hypothetical protein